MIRLGKAYLLVKGRRIMAKRTCECGECAKCKHREYMNAWYRLPGSAERVRAWAKRYRQANLEQVHAYDNIRARYRDPEKDKARRVINHLVKQGRLQRPGVCEVCGSDPGYGSDGRSLIQAHHEDYSQPLDVEWLCISCHGKRHRLIA